MRPAPIGRSLRDRGVAVVAKLPLEAVLNLLGKWRGVLVLNYHRVGDSEGQPWDRTAWSASAEELDRQLHTLAGRAEVIGPGEVPAALRAGLGRRVLITFDDGYRDNYELAFPLLRRHGLTAAFFLASGFLDSPRAAWWDEIAWMVRHAADEARGAAALLTGGGSYAAAAPAAANLLPDGIAPAADREATIAALVARYKALPDGEGELFLEQLAAALGSGRCGAGEVEELWMTWEMARKLHAAGMSIGGHTVTHPILARLPPERQREEIDGCARRLREEVGVALRWFAYPVGSRDAFTPLTQGLLREHGVELAFSYYGGFAGPSRWNPLDVPRVHVDSALAPRLLAQRLLAPRLLTRFAG
jgi:peptidoglycan/xylan/chitin deacetylase (PgdA/CDA1 family)